MKNVLKSTLATTAGVSALMATSVAAAASFNVVIDKIQLVDDASDVTAGQGIVTVYDPANSIGADATTTVDLFNATSAAGTSFGLATPADGVYDSAVITFSTVEISGTTNLTTVDYATVLEGANLAYNMNAGDDNGKTKLVLGSRGTGLSSLDNVIATNASQAPAAVTALTATPIVVSGGAFTLPTLNIKLPSASVEDTASGLVLTQAPVISTIKPTTSVDSTVIGDLTVGVDLDKFEGVTGFTSGTSVINLGLFTAATEERPLVQTELTTSTTYATGASGTTYEFVDVAGTVCPIAWFDADGDDLLDAGESITVANTTISTNCTTVGTTDVNYTATAELLDEAVIALAPREISVTIPVRLVSETTAADANAVTGSGVIATAGANVTQTTNLDAATASSLTISIANDAANTAALRRTFNLDVLLASHTENAVASSISETDVVAPAVSGTTQFSSITGVSYVDGATNSVVITGVPVFAPTTYAADVENSAANYDVTVDLTFENTSSVGDAFDDGDGANQGDVSGNDVTIGDDQVNLGALN